MAWDNKPTTKRKNWIPWAMRHLDYICAQCGAEHPLELDHIKNLKAGGTDTQDNLQWLCVNCHKRKTAREAKVGLNAWKKPQEEHPALRRARQQKGL